MKKVDYNFIFAVIVLSAAIFISLFFSSFRKEVEFQGKSFYRIPHKIGEWVGKDYTFSQDVYDVLQADENLYRIYKRNDGAELGLYIGYYGTKRGGHPEHVPTGCYPGSGWGIEEIKKTDVEITDNKIIEVNNLYAVKGERKEQTLYWLQNFLGNVSNSGWQQNIEKMKTKLLYRRNDGAFIRINSTVKTNREDTIKYQKDFIKKLYPYLIEYWPLEE